MAQEKRLEKRSRRGLRGARFDVLKEGGCELGTGVEGTVSNNSGRSRKPQDLWVGAVRALPKVGLEQGLSQPEGFTTASS